MDYILVYVTASSMDEGKRIARTLVEEGLVACANILPGVRSIYRWKGKVCDDEEVFIMMKSRKDLFDRIRNRVKELHSYEVPEIIAFPVTMGSPDYLEWMDEVLKTLKDLR